MSVRLAMVSILVRLDALWLFLSCGSLRLSLWDFWNVKKHQSTYTPEIYGNLA